ncbi:MAG: PEP-CTERM sorting domain-containing protein [Pirellulales bacterium]
MNYISRNVVFAMTALLLGAASASAAPIAVDSYVYQNPAEWALHWSSDPNENGQTVKRLTDGVVGPWSFANQVAVGYQHNPPGTSADAIPMVDLDLGGTFQVESLEVNYIIDYVSGIFAPQIGMDILGSTDGTNFSLIGSKVVGVDFPTVAQSQAAQHTGVQSAVFDFGPGGTTATHIRVDVRTWATFFFMSEITVNAVPEPSSIALLGLGLMGFCLAVRHRRSWELRAGE